jgi:hypothetical protein
MEQQELYSTGKLIFIFGLLNILFSINGQSQPTKVTLSPSMITNESGVGDAGLMVDEQALSGDPASGNDGNPVTKWYTAYSPSNYPASAHIDFGNSLNLSQIFIYDYNGVGDLVVEYGEPGNWTFLFLEPCNNYKKWKEHFVNCNTRYIRFTKTGPHSNFNEVVIYASNAAAPVPAITNLAVDSVSENTVSLSWTDVQLNGLLGNITGYDLRFSSQQLTAQNFYDNARYPIPFLPGDSGTVQSITIPNFESDKTWYFALKVEGDIPNSNPTLFGGSPVACTPVSNIVDATTNSSSYVGEYRIVLEPFMINNPSGLGDATKFVDEQLQTGDPANSNYEPVGEWFPGPNQSLYPLSAYIDLGTVKHLTKMYLFDVNSVGDIIVEYGQPGSWHFLFSDELNTYKTWRLHEFDKHARYIRFTLTDREAKVSEVVLYANNDLPPFSEQKIAISTSMITNVSGYGDATLLVDEQLLSGDPANSTGGNPANTWSTGANSSIPYPCYAVLDIGRPVEVTKIFLRDVNGTGNFSVEYGNPFNWLPMIEDGLTGYLTWNQHNVTGTTRYLRFGRGSFTSNVSEVVVYGYDYYQNNIDTIPPAGVTNLEVTIEDTTSLTLSWTAPGDDNWTGQALLYDFRFSNNPINAENFLEAESISVNVYPLPGGQQQTLTIPGLNSRTPYYFAFYAYDDFENQSPLSNNATGETLLEINGPIQKIFLSTDMVLNEWVQGDATYMVDEQALAGEPINNAGVSVENRWDMDCADWFYPGSAIIDLGAMYDISDIFLYDDIDGSFDTVPGPVSVSIGSPFNWSLAFEDSLLNSGTWNAHIVDAQSRYIRVTLQNRHTRFSEIVVYGSAMSELEIQVPEPVNGPSALMDKFIGVNGFNNDPIGRLNACGSVREYHTWMWIEGNYSSSYPGYPNNENAWFSSSTGFDFDNFYGNMKNSGILCSPGLQGNTVWMAEGDYSKLSHKPVSPTDDPLQPESYIEHADHLFQFGARYGSSNVSNNLLKVEPGNQVLTGLDLVEYYENWNEQDKWWKGRGGFFLPYEYAAMSSADCDGHLGTMGATIGLKNADPNAKLVMGGIAAPKLDYIRAMKLWCDNYRSGDFPWDVINVHHYCNDAGAQFSGTVGISPEEDELKERMEEFVDYRNRYLPGVEVWISEFGYDTHQGSAQRAPAIGSFSREEVQGQWIVRSYLALAAAKVDKAMMYMLKDVDENSSTQFNTAGLTQSAAESYTPKPSWYYVYTMKNRLNGMYFDSEVPSGNPLVRIYKFVNNTTSEAAYVLWCPTSNQSSVQGYSLPLSTGETAAMLVEMQVGNINGIESNLSINSGGVSVDVSERPVFVMVNDGSGFSPLASGPTLLALDTSMLVNQSAYPGAEAYIDEQASLGDPYMGEGLVPQTSWSTPTGTSGYPYECYIDLGQEYDIAYIYLYDENNQGNLQILSGEPGNWNSLFTESCKGYTVWNGYAVNVTTRYIQISKEEHGANIGEILIYVK